MTTEPTTLFILTDAESRFMREALEELAGCGDNRALLIFNRGVIRGTERATAEFKAAQKAKRKP